MLKLGSERDNHTSIRPQTFHFSFLPPTEVPSFPFLDMFLHQP